MSQDSHPTSNDLALDLEQCMETEQLEDLHNSAGKATSVDASTQFDGDPDGKVSRYNHLKCAQ